jgi:hypothetical protein
MVTVSFTSPFTVGVKSDVKYDVKGDVKYDVTLRDNRPDPHRRRVVTPTARPFTA